MANYYSYVLDIPSDTHGLVELFICSSSPLVEGMGANMLNNMNTENPIDVAKVMLAHDDVLGYLFSIQSQDEAGSIMVGDSTIPVLRLFNYFNMDVSNSYEYESYMEGEGFIDECFMNEDTDNYICIRIKNEDNRYSGKHQGMMLEMDVDMCLAITEDYYLKAHELIKASRK